MSPLLNGSLAPDPITLRAGTAYRFRFMNITLFNAQARIRLVRDGFPVMWRAVAKDGADLPRSQRRVDLADRVVSVGETMDFEFRPTEPGEYRLEARSFVGERFVEQRIDVIAETVSANP
jgi:FtsP/CotA-like multicopper oxidase with cupredoxin domain